MAEMRPFDLASKMPTVSSFLPPKAFKSKESAKIRYSRRNDGSLESQKNQITSVNVQSRASFARRPISSSMLQEIAASLLSLPTPSTSSIQQDSQDVVRVRILTCCPSILARFSVQRVNVVVIFTPVCLVACMASHGPPQIQQHSVQNRSSKEWRKFGKSVLRGILDHHAAEASCHVSTVGRLDAQILDCALYDYQTWEPRCPKGETLPL